MEWRVLTNNLGRLFQVFLVASYAYYKRYASILPDEQYDKIAKILLTHWDDFEHPHKYLVTKEDLEAGTLYATKNYPKIIIHCAELQIQAMNNGRAE